MAKNKLIKTATLKKRFEKLHNAANYAEECAKAIEFHANRLSPKNKDETQIDKFQNMDEAIANWSDKFARLGSAMQEVEAKYYACLTNDNMECELIEEVPNLKKNGYTTPDSYQVETKFFDIGYYKLEGDPYSIAKHDFSTKEIIDDIQYLHEDMIFFIKALANVDYKGIWKLVGTIAIDIYETVPTYQISSLLEAYGINPNSNNI